MSKDLIKSKSSALAKLTENNIDELIKPLQNKVHLMDTRISGLLLLDNDDLIESLELNQELVLKREPLPYDKENINIYTLNNEIVGYIEERDNSLFAKLMDAGKKLTGRIKEINSVQGIKVIILSVDLIDF